MLHITIPNRAKRDLVPIMQHLIYAQAIWNYAVSVLLLVDRIAVAYCHVSPLDIQRSNTCTALTCGLMWKGTLTRGFCSTCACTTPGTTPRSRHPQGM